MGTILSAEVRIWHPTRSVSELEGAFGQSSKLSHQLGAEKGFGTGKHARTYCVFEVAQSSIANFRELVARCIDKMQDFLRSQPSFRSEGGESYVVIAYFEQEVLEFDLPQELVERLSLVGSGLWLQNKTEGRETDAG